VLALRRRTEDREPEEAHARPGKAARALSHPIPQSATQIPHSAVLRMKLVGANPQPRVEGQEELPGKINYFLGNDPKRWRTNVPTYSKVKYHSVYPGVDLVYYGRQQQLEYDLVVAPGADPKSLRPGWRTRAETIASLLMRPLITTVPQASAAVTGRPSKVRLNQGTKP
jgi:hypothetical protein